jgi:hypothetical protein
MIDPAERHMWLGMKMAANATELRINTLVVSPLRIACVFPHVERGRSSKRVWRSPRIIHYFNTGSAPDDRASSTA